MGFALLNPSYELRERPGLRCAPSGATLAARHRNDAMGHNRAQKAHCDAAARAGYTLRKSRGESRPLCARFASRADRCMLGRALPHWRKDMSIMRIMTAAAL